jgi:hypothetical protein
MDEIIKLLECPVCFQHSMSDTYIQCINGHSGCVECFSRLRDCPICRTYLKPTITTFSQETATALKVKYFQVTKLERTAALKVLMELFKCTLCNHIPTRRNILQCPFGHIKCSECENPPEKQRICFLCDYDLLSICRYRSIFAEKLWSLVTKACRYTDRGCNATMLDLTDHERDDCIFRDVRCIFIKCYEIMPLCMFLSHIQESNQKFHYFYPQEPSWDKIVTENTGFVDLPERVHGLPAEKWHKIINLTLAGNKSFFFVFSAISVLGTCVAWVYYVGTPNEAKHFGFHLKLFKKGSDKEIKVTGPVISVIHSCFITYTIPEAFTISLQEVRKFWSMEKLNLSWTVSVFEKKLTEGNEIIVSIQK